MGIATVLMPVSLFITSSPLSWAIVFFSIAMFGHQFFSTLLQTLCTDLFPSRVVGSVAGLAGGIGCFGAMLFSLLAGQMIQNLGYSSVFVVIGLLHPISFLLILLLVGEIKQVKP